MFPQSEEGRKRQGLALADALIAYTGNCDNIPSLTPLVESVAKKHVAKGVSPHHYLAVGTILLNALEELLGKETFNADVKTAVAEAYFFLANIFMETERNMALG